MKKLFLFMCMALAAVTSHARSYLYDEPESGDFAIGLNINQGTRNPVFNLGLGAKAQLYATRALRVEASFNGFFEFKNVSYWDTNLNFHYLFDVAEQFHVYPILGATFMHGHYEAGEYSNREGSFGVNVGAGLQYDINEHIYVMAEGVYKHGTKRWLDDYEGGYDYKIGPRVNVLVGIAYRF